VPRYNEFYYDTAKYGIRSPLAYSAEPVSAVALTYDTIGLEWRAPSAPADADYTAFRIIRNQNGFPQTQEDGITVYSSIGHPTNTYLNDTSAIHPLVAGRFVFYRAWVQRAVSGVVTWVNAGSAYTLLPSPHNLSIGVTAKYTKAGLNGFSSDDGLAYYLPGVSPFVSSTHDRFMSLFPRVITSTSNSALDVPNNVYDRISDPAGAKENSLLPTFLSAFSFSLDEMLTFSQLVSSWNTPTGVFLGSDQLGMTQDIEAVTATQQSLINNAISIYSKKGTYAGLELLTQSMTHYDATVSDTRNLLFSTEDSSFNMPEWQENANSNASLKRAKPAVGNWATLSSSVSLDVNADQAGSNGIFPSDAASKFAIDRTFCGKVTPSSTNQSIGIGLVDPVSFGIPVTPSLHYVFSGYILAGTSGSKDVTLEIHWFDRRGGYISKTSKSIAGAITSWTRYSSGAVTAPAEAAYAGIKLAFAQNNVFYVDMVQFEEVPDILAAASVYQEPRGAVLYVAPSKVNLVTKPSFALESITGWNTDANGALTRQTSGGLYGAETLRLARNSAGNQKLLMYYDVPVTENTYYTASIYAKDVDTAGSFFVSFTFKDAAAATITFKNKNNANTTVFPDPNETNYATNYPATLLSTGDWTRVYQTVRTPATAATMRVTFSSFATLANSKAVVFDAALVEKSSLLSDYFDGENSSEGGIWQGTRYNSLSGLYQGSTIVTNKNSGRLERLRVEIPTYLGVNTPYYITLYNGAIYASGIS